MVRLKGISPVVAFVLIILIAIGSIALILEFSTTGTERTKEILLLREGKGTLTKIDESIKHVSLQGQGSSVSLSLIISGGSYKIDDQGEKVIFTMDSSAQIIGIGVETREGNVNATGKEGYLEALIGYENVDIINGAEFGAGSRTLFIKNTGWDSVTKKQLIDITVS